MKRGPPTFVSGQDRATRTEREPDGLLVGLDAITSNLATVSFISLGGVLSGGTRWACRRFNKKHRIRILRDEAVDLLRAFSFYQQSQRLKQRPDQRASSPVETQDTLVEMLISLQDGLAPLNVHLSSADEMRTDWLLAADKPLKDGSLFAPFGDERLIEAALAVQSPNENDHRPSREDSAVLRGPAKPFSCTAPTA